jgi:tetratricopeptide (TPR) repeat protein
MYRAGQYREARRELTTVIQAHPDSPEIAEAYYLRGLCEIRLDDRSGGRKDLLTAASKGQRRDLRAKADATLGIMAYEDEAWNEAVRHLNQAVRGLPPEPPSDELLLRLATAQQRTGRWRDAKMTFRRVVAEFGQRPAGAAARRKESWPYEAFSIQSGAFRSEDNARKQAGKLRKAGLQATYRRDAYTSGLHVVYVGRYSTWQQAKGQLAQVQRVVAKAIIVP